MSDSIPAMLELARIESTNDRAEQIGSRIVALARLATAVHMTDAARRLPDEAIEAPERRP